MNVKIKELFPYTWQRQRPYHVESTGSRPIIEVKQRRARLVTWMCDSLGTARAVGIIFCALFVSLQLCMMLNFGYRNRKEPFAQGLNTNSKRILTDGIFLMPNCVLYILFTPRRRRECSDQLGPYTNFFFMYG